MATAVTGVTSEFVNWGVARAGRNGSHGDVDFPMGYTETIPEEETAGRVRARWQKVIPRDAFVICFFGAFGRQFDLDTVIAAARRLQSDARKFHFVLCGSGDLLDRYRNSARDCRNMQFPGWVEAPDIWVLMRMSAVGLAPYRNSFDFSSSLPNKVIEYLSAGRPLLSSLQGVVEQMLSDHDCGVTYREGDADDLVSKLVHLYDHPDRLKVMSSNATELFKERFTASQVYSRMAVYLEKMAGHGRQN